MINKRSSVVPYLFALALICILTSSADAQFLAEGDSVRTTNGNEKPSSDADSRPLPESIKVKIGDPDFAISEVKRAYEGRKGEASSIMMAMAAIGLQMKAEGHYQDALAYFKESLAYAEKIGNEKVAEAMTNNMAGAYRYLKLYPQAEELYLALVEKNRLAGTTDSYKMAIIYDNLSQLYSSWGRYSDALDWGDKALPEFEKSAQEHPIDQIKCLSSLMMIHSRCGHPEEAEKLAQQTIGLCKRLPQSQENQFMTGMVYDNYGSILFRQAKYKEALAIRLKALDEFQSAVGPVHRDVAICLTNIAAVYDMLDEKEKSAENIAKAKKIFQILQGDRNIKLD